MQQKIEGASALNSIIQLFFKGIDKLLDSAAEYEEEMGVLKQVNKIPIQDKNGNNYTLIVKLSPVKSKPGVFYVEVDNNNIPGLDTSSVDKKAFNIGNRTDRKFNQLLSDLLSEQGFTSDLMTEPSDSQATSEESSDESLQESMEELEDQLEEKFEGEPLVVNYSDKGLAIINRTLIDDDESGTTCKIKLSVIDMEGKPIKECPDYEFEINMLNDSGEEISFDEFYLLVQSEIKNYMADHNLKTGSGRASFNSCVNATFVKHKDSDDIELTAITASCDIHSAWDIVEDVINDDSFFDYLLPDQPQSYQITEDDEGCYDIEPIEEVDRSDSYRLLFNQANQILQQWRYIRWAVGCRNWESNSFLCDMHWRLNGFLDTIAPWIILQFNEFSVPELDVDPNLIKELMTEDQIIPEESVVHKVMDDANYLIELINDIYVNFEHSEQNKLDEFIQSVNDNFAYVNNSWN